MKRKLSLISILLALFLLFPTIVGNLGGQQPYAIPIANLLSNSGFGVWSQSDTNKGLATLTYDNLAGGNFAVGNTITGATSGAVGKLITDNGATQMTLGAVTGCFQDNEQIGNGAGVTADVDGDSGVGVANDPMNNDSTGDWTDDGANITLAFAAAEYTVTTNAAIQRAWMTNLAFTAGKLYKIEIDIKDGTQAGADIEAYFNDGAAQYGKIETTAAGWASIWFTFECATTTATGVAGFRIPTSLAGNNIEIRRFSVYEITPCCTISNTKAPDTWERASGLDIYRQHNDGGTLTKDGSFYALRFVPTAAGNSMLWPKDIYNKEEHIQKFAGRTVTFGIWLKTSTADHIRFSINDGGNNYSAYHTGGGAWEWIEYTHTVSATASQLYVNLVVTQAPNVDGTTIVYMSQPILVFGSSIGEGNYQPIPQEMIWLEKRIYSKALHAQSGLNSKAATDLNLEADSDGILPKNGKTIWILGTSRDSGSAANSCYIYARRDATQALQLINSPYGQTNSTSAYFPALPQALDENGDYDYGILATGVNTFSIAEWIYIAITLN